MTPATKEVLEALAELVEAQSLPFHDELLDITVAESLGWTTRRVTRLGLNGRTPGSYLWFPPDAPFHAKGVRRPPHFSGPKRRKATAAALRARAASIEGMRPNISEDNPNGN